MATVDEVARSALGALATDAPLPLAVQWASERYAEAALYCRFRHLRDLGAVVVPGALTTGLATATRDSTLVTGDATAQASWSNALVGRFFQSSGKTTWTEILSVEPGPQLRLRAPFAEDTVTAGSYRIVQRYATLEPEARTLGPFVNLRFRVTLDLIPFERLNALAPERQYFTYGPMIVSEFAEDVSRTKRVELYPYSVSSELVQYVFWRRPPTLELGDELPGAIDPFLLKEGVLVDCMRYETAKCIRAKDYDGAGHWGNHQARQQSRWEDKRGLLALADRGVDDAMFLVGDANMSSSALRDIRTARDEVYARGNRP